MNALVASASDTDAWYEFSPLSQDLGGTVSALSSGNWVAAGLDGFAGTMDVVDVVTDPLATLISWGVGFMIDHIEPFPTWMDKLVGNPGEIASFAATWQNCAGRVGANASQLRASSADVTASWHGLAATAYHGTAQACSMIIDTMAALLEGVAAATQIASSLVAGVREFVKGKISEILGQIAGKLVELLTVVLAPHAIATVTKKVAEMAVETATFIDDLLTTMGRLGDLLRELEGPVKSIASAAKKLHTKWDDASAITHIKFEAMKDLASVTAAPS